VNRTGLGFDMHPLVPGRPLVLGGVTIESEVGLLGPSDAYGLAHAIGQFAKQFQRFATGKPWPTWFDEGRASWFGNAKYQTVSFDGTTMKVGLRARGQDIEFLKSAAAKETMPGIIDLLVKDPRNLDGEARRIWYAEVWALHAWLMDGAAETYRRRFAEWQSVMDKVPTNPRDVDDVGLKEFLRYFAKDIPEMDWQFREWVKTL